MKYIDIIEFPEHERWELFNGQLYIQPMPLMTHQKVGTKLVVDLSNQKKQSFAMYVGIGVWPYAKSKDEIMEAQDFVIPDISIVKREQLIEEGCIGAPEAVIEITSPDTYWTDFIFKSELYGKIGVHWYVIISPCVQKEIWVVDEASMVDNVVMNHLLKAAELKNVKVCFVGDRCQLLPVGAGNAFANMIENGKIASITLDEIRRQRVKELQNSVCQAVLGGRDGVINSFGILEQTNAVSNIVNHKERFTTIVKDFIALNPAERENTVILTAGNKDRKELNQNIRKALKANHELDDGQVFNVKNNEGIVYKREFSINDKVMFLQNDKWLGVQNGQTGFVEKIEGNEISIRCGQAKNSQTVNVNLDKYNYLDHGYTMTTHKAQGITANRVLINLDTSQKMLNSRNSYYVDISRARYDVKIYTDDIDKIKDQVKKFAIKLTSDDFLISKIKSTNKSPEGNKRLSAREVLDSAFEQSKKWFKELHWQKTLCDMSVFDRNNTLAPPNMKHSDYNLKKPKGPSMSL